MIDPHADIVAKLEELSRRMWNRGTWGSDLETLQQAMDTIVDLRVEIEQMKEKSR
jgi:hypothetical protein